MLTNKDYCDYETCVALKELGFPQDTSLARYALVNKWVDYCTFKKGQLITSEDRFFFNTTEESIIAPLLYLAQKWLREEKEFYVFVGREWENAYYYWLSKKDEDKTVGITHSFYYSNEEGQFSSYEEALSEGIKEAVKILKER